MGETNTEEKAKAFVSNTYSQHSHDEEEALPVRSRSPVPVWKTPSIHDKKQKKKSSPKPVHTGIDTSAGKQSDIAPPQTFEMEELSEEMDAADASYEPVESAKIIKEKPVRRAYVAEIISFFRRFLPDAVSESKLRTLNLILAFIAVFFIIIIFVAVVLN